MSFEWRILDFQELSNEQLYGILKFRQSVFIMEQECAYLDLDDKDQASAHVLCLQDTELKAYQRCLPPGVSYPESSLGRIAVDPDLRGRQLGKKLVQKGIDYNLEHWPGKDICISAQAHLQDYYTTLGFCSEGLEYMEDNIPHRKMRLSSGS